MGDTEKEMYRDSAFFKKKLRNVTVIQNVIDLQRVLHKRHVAHSYEDSTTIVDQSYSKFMIYEKIN